MQKETKNSTHRHTPANIKRRVNRKSRRKKLAKRFFLLVAILYIIILFAILFVFSISLKSCNKPDKKHDVNIQTQDEKTKTEG